MSESTCKTTIAGTRELLERLRLNAGDKSKDAMQRDGEQAAAEIERLQNIVAGLLSSDVGRQTLQKLADGQGTNTADGQAWLRAQAMP